MVAMIATYHNDPAAAQSKTFRQNYVPLSIKGLRLLQDTTETHPGNWLIGYARVSTDGQTLDSQLKRLRTAGCNSRDIYREKITGARGRLT
jgi:hypothetical protein